MKIVLIGLGHEMHGDDEIGLQVVSRWAVEHGKGRPEVEALTLESPGLNLLGTIAGQAAAILVAAVQSGAPLGAIHKLNQEKLVRFLEEHPGSHPWRAAETLSLGRRLIPEELPEKLFLIGIEGAAFGLGEGLSPAIRSAIPQALAAINSTIDDIQKNDPSWKRFLGELMWKVRHFPGNS